MPGLLFTASCLALGAATATACTPDSALGGDSSQAAAAADGADGAGGADGSASSGSDAAATTPGGDDATSPRERVFYVTSDDGSLYAYREGTWELLQRYRGLPITDGVRGLDVDPAAAVLYVAHGGDGGQNGTGSLLAWSLTDHRVVYDRKLAYGVDQLAYGAGKIYMPEGEASSGVRWHVLSAASGEETGTEPGGASPHNTIFRNQHRYYGGRYATSLTTIGAGAGAVGPSPSASSGVRPFTINAAETRAWITWTNYRGFSVGDVSRGTLLKSINFGPLPAGWTQTTASHGVSLSPDGAEVYVLDMTADAVRVYDGSDDPKPLATIALSHTIYGGSESPCAYDCTKVGWLLHSRDGRYVYVGDSGDVIDTKARAIATYLAPLHENRHGFVEVDWTGWPAGSPLSTTTHFGMGY